MYRDPRSPLVLSLWIAVCATDTVVRTEDGEAQSVYCPSYCDDRGYHHTSKYCGVLSKPYCCLLQDDLNCCANKTLAVSDSVKDNYNCVETLGWLELYWKTILGVCLALAVISVVGAVTLCSIQSKRTKRRRRQLSEIERQRSNSAISSVSGTSSCSRTTLGAPPSPVVVLSSSRRSSPDLEHLRTHGLRVPLKPPPYTADKPPQYGDIMLELRVPAPDGTWAIAGLDGSWGVASVDGSCSAPSLDTSWTVDA